VGEEPDSENIKYGFDDVETAGGFVGLDGLRIQSEVEEEKISTLPTMFKLPTYIAYTIIRIEPSPEQVVSVQDTEDKVLGKNIGLLFGSYFPTKTLPTSIAWNSGV
jgi:hypothetical protein